MGTATTVTTTEDGITVAYLTSDDTQTIYAVDSDAVAELVQVQANEEEMNHQLSEQMNQEIEQEMSQELNQDLTQEMNSQATVDEPMEEEDNSKAIQETLME